MLGRIMATLRSTKVLTRFFLPTSISALSYHLLLGLAKTLWSSEEWTKNVNKVSHLPSPSATPDPPTGQTYTPATGTTPGSRYEVSVKSWDLGAIRRCPV